MGNVIMSGIVPPLEAPGTANLLMLNEEGVLVPYSNEDDSSSTTE